MLSHAFEADWEHILLSVIKRPFILYNAKVQNLKGRVYVNRINDISTLILLHQSLRWFLLWLHELLLRSRSRSKWSTTLVRLVEEVLLLLLQYVSHQHRQGIFLNFLNYFGLLLKVLEKFTDVFYPLLSCILSYFNTFETIVKIPTQLSQDFKSFIAYGLKQLLIMIRANPSFRQFSAWLFFIHFLILFF